MAFVVHFDSSGNADFACSGTLVSSNVVLTAGHCAVDETTAAPLSAADYRVVTGAVDWTDAANRHVSGVSQALVAPNFDPSGPIHDAALLVLSAPVSDPPVALWGSGLLAGGTRAVITGWGRTTSGQTAAQTLLQAAATVVQSAAYCAQPFLANYTFDAASELCAIDPPSYTTGTCEGDSGGPLLAQTSGGTWMEIGLTSVGAADCNTQVPGYYTATQPLASWVSSQVRLVAPPGASGSGLGGSTGPSGSGSGSASTSASGSSASGIHPVALTLSAARADVRQTITRALSHRVRVPSSMQLACGSLSSTPVRCRFSFRAGANRYAGAVALYAYASAANQTHWSARYSIRWIRAGCSSPSKRRGCSVHHRAGTA